MGFRTHLPDDGELMLEINTTPLIDVMLVLLVMLIVTIPIELHSVDLRTAGAAAAQASPQEVVRVDIDAANRVRWNGALVADRAALDELMRASATRAEPPALHIRAEPLSRYETLVGVLAAAERLGITRIGVIGSERHE